MELVNSKYRSEAQSTLIVKEAAKFALAIQSACNLRAITASFLEQLDLMRQVGICGDLLNSHPVVVLFASKLNSLCHVEDEGVETEAYNACFNLAEGRLATYKVFPL